MNDFLKDMNVDEKSIDLFVQLTAKDRYILNKISKVVFFEKNAPINIVDTNGARYFYIIKNGMVQEYENKNGEELLCGVYCDNDLFGWYDRNTFYKSTERVIARRIDYTKWQRVQSQTPSLNSLWLSLLEMQVHNMIKWQEMFCTMTAYDLFLFLQKVKPELWRKSRLQDVIASVIRK